MISKKAARKYVGGKWEEAGKKQFDFMIKEGLKPEHKLLEIGCGCGRAGRYFVDYLNSGNYYGLDHHEWLINFFEKEIGGISTEKKPNFFVNDNFVFLKKTEDAWVLEKVDYVLAKSVFTHLVPAKIKQCCDSLRYGRWGALKEDGVFYASIHEGDSSNNPKKNHDNKKFQYSLDEIRDFASGWTVERLGRKGTFKQTMLKFKIKKI